MKKYSLAKDTISKDELIKLSEWMVNGNKLTKGKLTIKFENKLNHVFPKLL